MKYVYDRILHSHKKKMLFKACSRKKSYVESEYKVRVILVNIKEESLTAEVPSLSVFFGIRKPRFRGAQ